MQVGWSIGVWVVLWAPLVMVAVASVNAARWGTGWGGWTWDGYRGLAGHEAALEATWNTVRLAGLSTVIATVLGTLMGYGMAVGRFRGRGGMEVILRVPMLVPDVVFAVALVMFYGLLRTVTGWFEPGFTGMVMGHVSFQVPFVALVVRARAAGLDPMLVEAARDLGAGPVQAFLRVTLPLLAPGVLGGALVAMTLSLDDFAVSFFTGGPGSTTLPVLIYATARRGITPELHALSTLLWVGTLVLVLFWAWCSRWNRPGRGNSG